MSNTSLSTLLSNPPLSSPSARALWSAIGSDPFAKIDLSAAPTAPSGDLPYASGKPLLPIEWWRGGLESLPFLVDRARIFRSSGTTSMQRTISPYSTDGLLLYKLGALKTFFWVLKQVAPDIPKAISLIPDAFTWPDSSLAQMVSWIAEFMAVDFVDATGFHQYANRPMPVLLLGTAFHLINTIDAGHAVKLPQGSVVFETGGTKGRARFVTRDQLYEAIESAFGVPPTHVISEYGMCELASQAYDWHQPGHPRQFRFPGWCTIYVSRKADQLYQEGCGALCIADPLRIDMPAILRTEDQATLTDDRFILDGRLRYAPLKGCSLNAESIMRPKTDQPYALIPRARRINPEGNPLSRLIEIQALLNDKACIDALAAETGSRADAQWLWSLWQQGWHHVVDPDALVAKMSCQRSWLIISPHTHSLAALYPLLLGSIAGYSMTVRLTEDTGLLRHLAESLPSVQLADSQARLNQGFSGGYDGIIAFGESTTVSLLAEQAAIPVQGFGSSLVVSVCDAARLPVYGDALARDCFALGQRGCMNTRALVLIGDAIDLEDVARTMTDAFLSYWQAPLTIPLACQIACEATSHQYWQSQQYQLSEHTPLFRMVPSLDPQHLMASPLCLPIMAVSSLADAAAALASLPQLTTVTSHLDLSGTGIPILSPGSAHLPHFDGTWQGQQLFDPAIFG